MPDSANVNHHHQPNMVARLLILLLAQLTIVNDVFADENHALTSLRFDGVYVGNPFAGDEKYCHYLRFYPKGTVIAVSSVCDSRSLKDIKRWFRAKNAGKNHSGTSLGRILVEDDQISFDAVSREGKVSYKGGIVGDQLLLRSYSHINGNNDSDNYTFVRW